MTLTGTQLRDRIKLGCDQLETALDTPNGWASYPRFLEEIVDGVQELCFLEGHPDVADGLSVMLEDQAESIRAALGPYEDDDDDEDDEEWDDDDDEEWDDDDDEEWG